MTKLEVAMQRLDEAIEKIKSAERVNIIFQDGRKVQGRMMCTFDCNPMHYVYMLFTDDTKTVDRLYNTYVAKFHVLLGFGPDGDEEKMKIELVDGRNAEELKMINDVIKKSLSTGVFKRKSICNLRFDGISEVYFD